MVVLCQYFYDSWLLTLNEVIIFPNKNMHKENIAHIRSSDLHFGSNSTVTTQTQYSGIVGICPNEFFVVLSLNFTMRV